MTLKFKVVVKALSVGDSFLSLLWVFFFFLLGNCLCRCGGSNPRPNGFMVNRIPLGLQGPVVSLLWVCYESIPSLLLGGKIML